MTPWGERVRMTVSATSSTATSYYPTVYFTISGVTSTKHIYANGELIATVSGSGTKAVVQYVHTDHLGGTDAVTSASGTLAELMDYMPYGSLRFDQQTGFNDSRKYIGQEYDPTPALSYLNARYYDGSKARFLSQDPIFQLVGDQGFSRRFGNNWRYSKAIDQAALQQYLANPQNLNSYSYALGNPVRYSDPTGDQPYQQIYDLLVVNGPENTPSVINEIGSFVNDLPDLIKSWYDTIDKIVDSIPPSIQQQLTPSYNVSIIGTDNGTMLEDPGLFGRTIPIKESNADSKPQRSKRTQLDSLKNTNITSGGGSGAARVGPQGAGSSSGYNLGGMMNQSFSGLLVAIQRAIDARPSAKTK